VQDITERKYAEDQLAHQALHDGLTGLPNRVLFLDRLGHAMVRTRRDSAAKPVVMFVDLDRFKVVNDSLGHGAGDELLVETAKRIESVLRPGDTVARLGGDEFTVLCEGAAEVDAIGVAERIAQALAVPFTVQSRNLFLSASIGIASSGGPDDSPELLVRDADAAMYRAKGGGGGGHAVFSKAMLGSTVKRLELESSLRRAIDQNELCLFYQPEVALDTGAIVGFEALIRWRHPERGMVSPAEFIPLAEETGLIIPIGAWVLQQACREAQHWREHHPEWGPLKISVNISPRQLAEPGLAELVCDTLAATQTQPEDLWLEITETTVMDEGASGPELLAKLKDIGVGIAIDDFGVGFSSLSRLKELPPVDAVKLDKAFIDGICTTAGDRAIAVAGIALARALGAVTVAEGVETAEQAALLRELTCELAQGYHFARPRPRDELGDLFAFATRTTG
jgi:diguanylate cyclase (GGDEF)-like protein